MTPRGDPCGRKRGSMPSAYGGKEKTEAGKQGKAVVEMSDGKENDVERDDATIAALADALSSVPKFQDAKHTAHTGMRSAGNDRISIASYVPLRLSDGTIFDERETAIDEYDFPKRADDIVRILADERETQIVLDDVSKHTHIAEGITLTRLLGALSKTSRIVVMPFLMFAIPEIRASIESHGRKVAYSAYPRWAYGDAEYCADDFEYACFDESGSVKVDCSAQGRFSDIGEAIMERARARICHSLVSALLRISVQEDARYSPLRADDAPELMFVDTREAADIVSDIVGTAASEIVPKREMPDASIANCLLFSFGTLALKGDEAASRRNIDETMALFAYAKEIRFAWMKALSCCFSQEREERGMGMRNERFSTALAEARFILTRRIPYDAESVRGVLAELSDCIGARSVFDAMADGVSLEDIFPAA